MMIKKSFFPSFLRWMLLWIFTLGIYPIYWIYQTWKFLKKDQKLNINPFMRTFLATLFLPSLFVHIKRGVQSMGKRIYLPAIFMGLLLSIFLLLTIPLNPYYSSFFLCCGFLYFPWVYMMEYYKKSRGIIPKKWWQFTRGEGIVLLLASLIWICFFLLFLDPELFSPILDTPFGRRFFFIVFGM